MAGTELAKAYVQIIPSADGIKGKLTSALSGEASSAGDSAGKVAGNSLASKIKGVIAAAGIGTALKSALSEGADLQQSIGGIETLFKDSADKVIANARNAYMTAGLSANDYMESVTSFSASLLQGLAGDTNKAADVADMALTDMSDNANKMGTSMELIQNAYQGFAKQNYTMLDNLKLGYGGTKTEMQRLLADAQKLTGVKYDMDNLSDVYEAIHVIQNEMGITGTTAKESASTFSGSLVSMKATVSNLLGNLSLGEDIKPAMDALIKSTGTFLFDNLFPMVGNILTGLVDYIVDTAVNTDWGAVITQVLTAIRDALSTGISTYFGADTTMVNDMFGFLIDGVPVALQAIQDAFTMIWDACNAVWTNVGQPIWDAIMTTIQYVADNWGSISESIKTYFQTVCDFWSTAWTSIGQPIWDMISFAIGSLADLFAEHMPAIMGFFQGAISGIQDTWENHLKPVFEAIGTFLNEVVKPAFEFVWKTIIEPLITNVFGVIADLWNNTLKPVFDGICDFITGVFTGDWQKMGDGILGIVTGLWDGVKSIFSGVTDFLGDVVGGIKDYASEKWSEVGENTKKAWENVKKIVGDKMAEAKAAVEEHGGGIKGFFSAMGENLKKNWTDAFNKMNQASDGKLGDMLSTAKEKLADIKDAFSDKLNAAKEVVSGAIEKIKGFFKFDWSLPKLKMPHFSISGEFSLNPLKVPSFGIDWYAKAMNDPMIMDSPTAFGINSLGQLMAGGEKGSEVVSGTDTLMRMIAQAVSSQNEVIADSVNDGFARLLTLLIQYFPQFANMRVVMDTGETVGALAPAMDEWLGKQANNEERGI